MLSSQLSELRKILTEEQLNVVKEYICSITNNTKVTVSKFAVDTCLSTVLAKQILIKLVDMDMLSFQFIIRCPNCGLPIETSDNICDIPQELNCYNCELISDISTQDVEVIYTAKNVPFVIGRQNENAIGSTKTGVRTEDSLAEFLKDHNYSLNSITYSPTDNEYLQLKQKYEAIFEDNNSTTQKGKALENLVLQLFGLCKHFEVTQDVRLHPNQIDCYVRNKLCSPGIPGLKDINSFCIECKNEATTPHGEYMNKLHSILMLSNISFGIIVSKSNVPKTFTTLANQIYLKENIIIIWFTGSDLKEIIINKQNLLDCIEKKITEIKLNATKDLRDIGLYK